MITPLRVGRCVVGLLMWGGLVGWSGMASAAPVSFCTTPITEGNNGQCEFVLVNGNAFSILVGTGVGSLTRDVGTSEDGTTISIANDGCMGQIIDPGRDCRIDVNIMTGPVDGKGIPDLDSFVAGMTSPATNRDTGDHIAAISETADFAVIDACRTGESASRAGEGSAEVCTVPEPGTFGMIGIGLSSMLGYYCWRRRRYGL